MPRLWHMKIGGIDSHADAEIAFRSALDFAPGQVDATAMLVVVLIAQFPRACRQTNAPCQNR